MDALQPPKCKSGSEYASKRDCQNLTTPNTENQLNQQVVANKGHRKVAFIKTLSHQKLICCIKGGTF